MRVASVLAAACFGLLLCGCEGDYQGQPAQKTVEIKQTPDLNPRTDHDIQVNTPDVDVDIKKSPANCRT